MNILIHVDELFLKGSNISFFYNNLLKNIRFLFVDCTINRIECGIWLSTNEEFSDERIKQLSLIPGISNFSIAKKCKLDVEQIIETIDYFFENEKYGKTFRVSATRSNKKFEINSMKLGAMMGEYVMDKYGLAVNLTKFELNINIHILNDGAIVYFNSINGAGGLPSGTGGKMLCLLSGGIDSPVSAYKMMVRGASVDLFHAHNQTSSSDAVLEKIFDIAKQLTKYQPKVRLFTVNFEKIQREIVIKVPADYRMIINRRMFLKIATDISKKNNYKALITGDSLGQVASQTVENLNCAYSVNDMLKLSPLIAMNKREITDIAHKINTLEISQRPYEDCCSMFVALHPQTKAKLENVEEIEKNIDLSTLDKVEIKSYNFSMNN